MTPFAKFYGNLNQHMDEFVRIFPVHLDDIDTFERVTTVKKRQIPKTLTTSMEEIQNQALWENYPGFLAYDGYWKILTENTSFMTIKEVKKILDCTQGLKALMNRPLHGPYTSPCPFGLSMSLPSIALPQGIYTIPWGPLQKNCGTIFCCLSQ